MAESTFGQQPSKTKSNLGSPVQNILQDRQADRGRQVLHTLAAILMPLTLLEGMDGWLALDVRSRPRAAPSIKCSSSSCCLISCCRHAALGTYVHACPCCRNRVPVKAPPHRHDPCEINLTITTVVVQQAGLIPPALQPSLPLLTTPPPALPPPMHYPPSKLRSLHHPL